MAIQWHYISNGQQCGPVTTDDLHELALDGNLHPDDLVWREGMADWAPAGKVKGLFDGVTTKPPPKPPRVPKPEKEVAVRIVEPRPSTMASVAKWATIGWSVFCLFGVIYGIMNVGANVQPEYSDAENAGAVIGMGCGMAFWCVIWAVIAVPSLVIWVLTRRT